MNPSTDITLLLGAAQSGDAKASERLLPLVYDELRRLARTYMSREKPGQTLQATALVHEAYLRLVGDCDLAWDSRRHFFAAAATAMRRILVERYRQKQALKQGGGAERRSIDPGELSSPEVVGEDTDLDLLDSALDRLAAYDPRKAEIVMLRTFAGLSHDQVATAMNLSSATVRREWTYARAWLLRELQSPGGAST